MPLKYKYFYQQKNTLGSLGLIGSLLITLIAYLFGLPFLYFYTFVFTVISLFTMYISMVDDLYENTKSQFSFIIVLSLLILYFILRLKLLDFSLSVGDGSDYLWSGAGSVTKSLDTGFFLPLSSSVAGMGYQVLGLEWTPFMTTMIYSATLPLLYFFLKEIKLNIYLIILFLIFFESIPLTIWFSKTTFSEPIWQIVLLILLTFAYKILKTEKPSYINFLPLFLLIALAIFSRGSSIFLFGFIVFLSLFHFWSYQNKKVLLAFIGLLFFFDLVFFYILQIRTEYLIGWQFSRVVPNITSTKLFILLLSMSFLFSLFFLILSKYQEIYKKINIPLIITLLTFFFKFLSAYYFSLKSNKFNFFDTFLGKEFSFLIGNFGYIFTILVSFGILYMYYKASKGNKLFLIIIVFYVLFFIPFSTMDINYERPHELLLYWNRYYFSELFLVHIFSLFVALGLICNIINYYIHNVKYAITLCLFSIVSIFIFSLNSRLFTLVTCNGYLSNSSHIFEWVRDKTKNHNLVILYDPKIRYSAYNAQQLTLAGFSRLKTKSVHYEKNVSTDIEIKNLIKKYCKDNKDNPLLLCLSRKPCSYDNENIILIDKMYTSLEWIQHTPKLNSYRFLQTGIETSLYKLIPSLTINKKYVVNKQSSIIPRLLEHGWWKLENGRVWSKPNASMRIPMPNVCKNSNCLLKLNFRVFGANKLRPKKILFKIGKSTKRIVVDKNESLSYTIDIPSNDGRLTIKNLNAVSPYAMGLSSDRRILGIALESIKLEKKIETKKGIPPSNGR